MAILPPTRIEKLEFVEAHLSAWSTNAVAIGLTAGQVSALSSQTSAARAAYNAMVTAHENGKNATQNFYNICQTMIDTTADYLKTIKAFAATTNNPSVFTLAVIPPPKTPAPTPPPATPTDLVASLENLGAIRVAWKASIARGTAFSVWRKLNQPTASYEQIATVSGQTSFVDETLPAGAGGSAGTGVFYAVKAHRQGSASPFSEPVLIRFGSVDGGDGEGELKIAA